jgi:hypothetical protein
MNRRPTIPKELVYLGDAVELLTDVKKWEWNKTNGAVVASNPEGNRLFVFPKTKIAEKNPTCSTGMRIQSYMFHRDTFNQKTAEKWLRTEGAKVPKVEVTANYLRYRQEPKSHFRFFRTGDLANDIMVTYGCPLKKWARYPNPSKAVDLYKRFNRRNPTHDDLLDVPRPSKRIGRALHIVYRSKKFGGKYKNYIHQFDNPPVVWADKTTNPKTLVIQGGKIRVTRNGIEG